MFRVKQIAPFLKGHIPGQLIVQFTNRCNAVCSQCGMNLHQDIERNRLSIYEVKKIIEAAAGHGIQAISFTGGEPFLYYHDLLEMIKFAHKSGIEYSRTGTNAFFLMNSNNSGFYRQVESMASDIGRSQLRNFWISIDSAKPDVHEEMRGLPGVTEGIRKALPVFHSYKVYPSVNLGINRYMSGKSPADFREMNLADFIQAFREFFSEMIELGFTMANICYPMSINDESEILSGVYGAHSQDNMVKFTPEEKIQIFRSLRTVIPEYRSKIRIFTPLSSVYALELQYTLEIQSSSEEDYPYPCRGGIDFFYINALDGNTYPCGYRGNENLGKLWDLNIRDFHNKPAKCRLCDWECFRDPAELCGPVCQAFTNPFKVMKKLRNDNLYRKLWLEDLKYYHACRFFDGRREMWYSRLRHFEASPSRPEPAHTITEELNLSIKNSLFNIKTHSE